MSSQAAIYGNLHVFTREIFIILSINTLQVFVIYPVFISENMSLLSKNGSLVSTSCAQKAKKYPKNAFFAIFGYFTAGSRGRTDTRFKSNGILSPARLPIPPCRHKQIFYRINQPDLRS